jgi:hypothetical protein
LCSATNEDDSAEESSICQLLDFGESLLTDSILAYIIQSLLIFPIVS